MTDAHIHNGSAGSNASVFVNVGLAAGELVVTDRAGHYLNVHTSLNPDGAIRGQLSDGSFVPGTSVPY